MVHILDGGVFCLCDIRKMGQKWSAKLAAARPKNWIWFEDRKMEEAQRMLLESVLMEVRMG